MAISRLGPKEIYNYNLQKSLSFIQDDSPRSIVEFNQFCKPTNQAEFLNGHHPKYNILMKVAEFANVTLLHYILENADPKILDMRDNNGFSALHWAVMSRAATKKIVACTQALIQAGADINARWTYEKYDSSHLPPAASALEPTNFVGENSLGFLVRQLFISFTTPPEKERYQSLIQIFLAYGAAQGCAEGIGWFSIEDGAKAYSNTLKEHVHKCIDWPKTRILYLGAKDSKSELSRLPEEIKKMLFWKICQANATTEQLKS